MRQLGLCIILCLCTLPLVAQDSSVENNQPEESKGVGGLIGDAFSGMQDLPKMPDSIHITNDGNLEFDSEKGSYLFEGDVVVTTDNGLTLKATKALLKPKDETATLTGDVSVIQKTTKDDTGRILSGIQIFADKVFLNAKAKTVTMDGNVSIFQGPTIHRGDHAVYNYETLKLDTQNLGSKLGPIILESDHFNKEIIDGKTAFIGKNAGITTHDVAKPNFWIRSDTTTIIPNDKIIFQNLKLYAGDTPIFWFPYLSQPLNADLGLHILPGARSGWGAYLLTSYGIMLGGEKNEITGDRSDAWLLSRWNIDLRSQRGVGLGLDLFDTRLDSNPNLGWMKLYYLNDHDSSYQRSSEFREPINDNRWKFEFKHRIEFQRDDTTSTYADFNITALSDAYFLEDFEPGIFKVDPNPNNELGIYHRNPRYLAGAYTRLRLNDFYESDTRLPEIFLDQIKAPVFNTPVLHEGQTSFGIYREYLADYHERNLRKEAAGLLPSDPKFEKIKAQLEDKGFSRFHTWHEFSLPMMLDNKITITPRGGLGVTSYWDIQNQTDSFTRTLLSFGVDASMKFSKLYPDLQIKSLGVDGLLHIIQPYASLSHLNSAGDSNNFQGIDSLTPSTRPPPLEVGRFPAIDSLSDWSILRLGGRNTLLTRRDGSSLQWFTMDTYIDVYLNDLQSKRKLSNLYNDIAWRPLPWMYMNIETQFPVDNDPYNFSEVASSFTFMPTDSTEFRIGYRWLLNHPSLNDSSRVDLRSYYRINDAWGIGTYHRYEFDDSTLEVQEYALNHDFGSWRSSAGLFIRDNRGNKNEYGFILNFTLNNFPAVRLPLSLDVE